jgi:hypothetical protein
MVIPGAAVARSAVNRAQRGLDLDRGGAAGAAGIAAGARALIDDGHAGLQHQRLAISRERDGGVGREVGDLDAAVRLRLDVHRLAGLEHTGSRGVARGVEDRDADGQRVVGVGQDWTTQLHCLDWR